MSPTFTFKFHTMKLQICKKCKILKMELFLLVANTHLPTKETPKTPLVITVVSQTSPGFCGRKENRAAQLKWCCP